MDCNGTTAIQDILTYEASKSFGEFLKMNPYPEITDACGLTQLQIAAFNHDHKSINLLLKHGAKQDLLSATFMGDLKLAKRLYLAGEDPREAGPSGITPLQVAADKGNLPMVQWLWEVTKGGKVFMSDVPPPGPCNTSISNSRIEFMANKTPLGLALAKLNDWEINAPTPKQRLAVAEFLLKKGEPLVKSDLFNDTIVSHLDLAVEACREDIVMLLFKRGANPNFKSIPLIHRAAQKCSPSLVAALIRRGANPTQKDFWGFSAIETATLSGNQPVVDFLKNSGLNIGIPPETFPQIRLKMAIENRDLLSVIWALNAGADPNKKMSEKDDELFIEEETPLSRAIEKKSFPIAESLLKAGANPNRESLKQNYLFRIFWNQLGKNWAELFINYGADVAASEKYHSLMRWALRWRQPDWVNFWLKHGADPTGQGGTEEFLLHHMAIGQVDFFDSFYTLEAYFLIKTPKHPEVTNFQLSVMNKLLKKGLKIDQIDEDGFTPLDWSVIAKQKRITSFLLKKGAKKSLVYCILTDNPECLQKRIFSNGLKEGSTNLIVFKLAFRKGNPKIIGLLLEAGVLENLDPTEIPKFFSGRWIPPPGNLEKIFNLLILHGYDPSKAEPKVLLNACARYPELALLLLENGMAASVVDEEGNTPLHFAAEFGTIDVVHALLKVQTSILPVNKDGQTPLDLAISKNRTEIVKLIQSNLKPKRKNLSFIIPSNNLKAAIDQGNTNKVTLLLAKGADPNGEFRFINPNLLDFGHPWDRYSQEPGLNNLTKVNRSFLWYSFYKRRYDIAHILLKNGAKSDSDFLFFLIGNSEPQPIELLLKHGHFAKEKQILSLALEYAASLNERTIVTSLLHAGASPHPLPRRSAGLGLGLKSFQSFTSYGGFKQPSKRTLGFFPLGWVSRNGDVPLASLMLKKGARINQQDNQGNTALHLACRFQKKALVQHLLTAGASRSIRNSDGILAKNAPRQGQCF